MNGKGKALLAVILSVSIALPCFAFFTVNTGKNTVFTSKEDDHITVVIDAGHGGEDGGAVSASGVHESRLNLEFALRLRDLLTFAGVRSVMIRDRDQSVYTGECGSMAEKKVSDLKNRVRLVSRVGNPLLISIHQNYFPESKYRGTQVFYAETDGSEELAQLVQNTIRDAVDPHNHRQIKKAESVYLMEHIACTGILVECGFLSNEEEAGLLQMEGYQKKLMTALCGAAVFYLNQGRKPDEI